MSARYWCSFWFFIIDVSEGLWNCDIGLFEGTRLGKGFWYDDKVSC